MPSNPFGETPLNKDEKEKIERLDSIIRECKELGFSFGKENNSIHAQQGRTFLKKFCKTDTALMECLKNGYTPNLRWRVPRYEEPNNNSAKAEMPFVRAKVAEWEQKGRLHEVQEKPWCINPLTVAMKYDVYEKKYKKRLVMDTSRCINIAAAPEKSKPDDLGYFEPYWAKDAYMTSFDLASMYHHMQIAQKAKQYFGFAVPQEDGTVKYYVMDVMPFGYGPAMAVLDWALNPAMNLFRQEAIKTGVFVDDGLNTDKNPRVVYEEIKFILTMLQIYGWNISWSKCQLIPVQVLLYQGFLVDLVAMEYRAPVEKVEYVDMLTGELIQNCQLGHAVQAKDLAGILGKYISLRRSHGNAFQVALRHTQNVLGKAVMHRGMDYKPDWKVSVQLDNQSIREMQFVKKHLNSMNGNPFPLQEKVEVFNLNGEIFKSEEAYRWGYSSYQVFASDASEEVAFVYEAETFNMVKEFAFNAAEKRRGSGPRELFSVLKTLQSSAEYFRENPSRVYWVTDSQNVYYFLKKGSCNEEIQKDVLRIKELEMEYRIQVVPIWKPRETQIIVAADEGSKAYLSTDEWSMDNGTFKKVVNYLGLKPTVDGFATSMNTKCEKYFSKYPQVGSSGLNFFAQKLDPMETYWICPPASQVAQAVQHMLQQEGRIIAYVSFPEWKSSNFWPVMVRGEVFASFVCAAFYSKPNFRKFNAAPSAFEGKTTFRMITVIVNTGGYINTIPYTK
jgi:hypothetical protein